MTDDRIRIEDHVRMFHAECGGIVTGELGQKLLCAECGKEMTAFLSLDEEAALRDHSAAIEEVRRAARDTQTREKRGNQ